LWYVFTEKEVLNDQYASTLSQSNLKSIKGKALFVAGRGVIEIYLVGRQSVDLSDDVVHGEVKPLIERDLACALGVHLGEMLDASNKSFTLGFEHVLCLRSKPEPPWCLGSTLNHLVEFSRPNLTIAILVTSLEGPYQEVVELLVLLTVPVDSLLDEGQELLLGDVLGRAAQAVLGNVHNLASDVSNGKADPLIQGDIPLAVLVHLVELPGTSLGTRGSIGEQV